MQNLDPGPLQRRPDLHRAARIPSDDDFSARALDGCGLLLAESRRDRGLEKIVGTAAATAPVAVRERQRLFFAN